MSRPQEVPNYALHTTMQTTLANRTQKAVELLQLSRSADLTGIAKELNVSSSRLRHILRKHLGRSPRRYVKALKLEQARQLLCTGFLSVKQVMATVGLHDISHFVRDYKSAFGETPSDTRRQMHSVLPGPLNDRALHESGAMHGNGERGPTVPSPLPNLIVRV